MAGTKRNGKSRKNIVSYEDMILKSKNPPIGETLVEKAGINDNVGDREAVFLHEAGERFSLLRTDGFQRKNLQFRHLTLMERRIARNLRESLSSSEKKIMKSILQAYLKSNMLLDVAT